MRSCGQGEPWGEKGRCKTGCSWVHETGCALHTTAAQTPTLHSLLLQAERRAVFRCAVLSCVVCRNFSARDESRCDCDTLQEVLASLPGARRMVVSRRAACCC